MNLSSIHKKRTNFKYQSNFFNDNQIGKEHSGTAIQKSFQGNDVSIHLTHSIWCWAPNDRNMGKYRATCETRGTTSSLGSYGLPGTALGECMVDVVVKHRGLKPLIGDVDPCLRYDGLEAMIRIALMVYARGDAEEAPPAVSVPFKDWNMKSHY